MFPHRLVLPAAVGMAVLAHAALAQPPEATPSASQTPDVAVAQATQAVQTCMVAKAKAADDGVSDPAVIAARIKDACGPEQARLLAASTELAGRHPGSEAAKPIPVTDKDRLEAAKAVVVQLRKARREGHETH